LLLFFTAGLLAPRVRFGKLSSSARPAVSSHLKILRENQGALARMVQKTADLTQTLTPIVFSTLYGPTKSRALIQNRSFFSSL
jgi:hypothetical protein